jgi:hypothetical protein
MSIIPHVSIQEARFANVINLMGCGEIQSFDGLTNESTHLVGRAHVWWYGGGLLLESFPGNWAGTWL